MARFFLCRGRVRNEAEVRLDYVGPNASQRFKAELNGLKERNNSHKTCSRLCPSVFYNSASQEDPDHSMLLLTSCGLSSIYHLRSLFPKMNLHELVNLIRSGPAELELSKPLLTKLAIARVDHSIDRGVVRAVLFRFRRRTCFSGRCNPCGFSVFLQALQSSETIRDVSCFSQLQLDITEYEWVLLVKTLGSIRDIRILKFYCTHGSRYFNPYQAVAEAVNSAHSLHMLEVCLRGETFSIALPGLSALANSLKEHTALQKFTWSDFGSRIRIAPSQFFLDLVLLALPACPYLREVFINTEYASASAMKTLLQLPKDTRLTLVLNTEHWLAVADGIGQGHCNIKNLYLALQLQSSNSKDTEAVKAIASAIRLDCNLEHLSLEKENAFTDEAGVALAEALTVNKTLHNITLSFEPLSIGQVRDAAADADTMSAPAYNAFSAMLRINTSLRLKLPPFNDAVSDERLVDSRNQMLIEQRLNNVGRGRLLASSQTPREAWVDALNELNAPNVDLAFKVSCLYSLLRLHPATCM
jgi:hypothetical protein